MLFSGILEDALPDCVGNEVVLGNIELKFPLRMSPHAVVPAAGLACLTPAERLQPVLEICAAHCEINGTTIVVQKQATTLRARATPPRALPLRRWSAGVKTRRRDGWLHYLWRAITAVRCR